MAASPMLPKFLKLRRGSIKYGGLDERVSAGIPAYEEALKKANVPYELYIYGGANHAFHNDTSAARYN